MTTPSKEIGIGAYEPEKLLENSHINPEQAVQVALDLNAKNIVGMQCGTLNLSDKPVDEPILRFNRFALSNGFKSEDVWLMKIGETKALNSISKKN